MPDKPSSAEASHQSWVLSSMAWQLAFRNLTRNVRRNLATGSALSLGFAGIVALLGFTQSVRSYLAAYTVYGTQIGHVTVYKKDGFDRFWAAPRKFSLNPTEQAEIQSVLAQVGNIEYASGQLLGSGLISNGCEALPFLATGIDPNTEKALRNHPELSRWKVPLHNYSRGQSIADLPSSLDPISVSKSLAMRLNKPKLYSEIVEQPSTTLEPADCADALKRSQAPIDSNVQLVAKSWSGSMNVRDAEIVGQFASNSSEAQKSGVVVALSELQKLFETDNVSAYSIWLKNPATAAEDAAMIQAELTKRGIATDVYLWTSKATNPLYAGTMNFLYIMIIFFALVLLTIVVFSIFNAATMTVIERAQETGMMRSLGFDRSVLSSLFGMEIFILSVFAIGIGGILAFVGIELIQRGNFRLYPPGLAGGMQLLMSPSLVATLVSIVILVFLTSLTAILVQRRVAGQKITQLLMGSNR